MICEVGKLLAHRDYTLKASVDFSHNKWVHVQILALWMRDLCYNETKKNWTVCSLSGKTSLYRDWFPGYVNLDALKIRRNVCRRIAQDWLMRDVLLEFGVFFFI